MTNLQNFQKSVLPNGLRIITEYVPGVRSVSIGIWVTVGSRDETPEQSGLSHFIEHMIFKGTEKRSALDIAKTFDRMGGLSNAFTSKETTCFHAKVLDEHLEEVTDLLADILLNSRFADVEVDRERQVILQEINMVEDSPDELIHELFSGLFWKGNPLERSILGSVDTVQATTSHTLKSYVNHYYVAPRILVVAAGNLEHRQFADMAEKAFGSIPSGNDISRRQRPIPNLDIQFFDRDLEQVHLLMGFQGPSAADPARFAALLMNVILGGSMSSRLFQEIREKRGLAYAIYSFLNSYHDAGLLGIYAGVAPQNVHETVALIKEEMVKLAENPLTIGELDAARDHIKGNLLLSAESTDARMSRLAKNEIDLGKFVSYDEIVGSIEKVTPEQVQDIAAKCLKRGMALACLGPVPEPERQRTKDLLT